MTTIKLEKRYPHIADEDVTEIFNAGYLQGWENARRNAIPVEWLKEKYSWLTMAGEIIKDWEEQNKEGEKE